MSRCAVAERPRTHPRQPWIGASSEPSRSLFRNVPSLGEQPRPGHRQRDAVQRRLHLGDLSARSRLSPPTGDAVQRRLGRARVCDRPVARRGGRGCGRRHDSGGCAGQARLAARVRQLEVATGLLGLWKDEFIGHQVRPRARGGAEDDGDGLAWRGGESTNLAHPFILRCGG